MDQREGPRADAWVKDGYFRRWIDRPFDPTRLNLEANKKGFNYGDKIVCGRRCNNGWMRRLDERMIPVFPPMMDGHVTSLSTEVQSDIAAWVTMKAMVNEFEPDFRTSYFNRTERQALRRTRPRHEPPPRTTVWIARAVDGSEVYPWARQLDLPWDGLNFMAQIRHLLLLAVFLKPNPELENPQLVNLVSPAEAVQIWPVDDVVTWPPPQSFDKDALDSWFVRSPKRPYGR